MQTYQSTKMSKNNPRKLHTGKSKLEKDNYQRLLSSSLQPNYKTAQDFSTESTDTSTVEEEKPQVPIKPRPKTLTKKVKIFFEDHGVKLLVGTVIAIFGWLFINDYNFNADIRVAENNISHLEKQIADYKQNGIISQTDYKNFELELNEIKNTYAKLEKVNELETNYQVLKTSIEKDMGNLQERLNKIQ